MKINAAYCINVETQLERWVAFQHNIAPLNLKVERFPAVPLSQLSITQKLDARVEASKQNTISERNFESISNLIRKIETTYGGKIKRSKKELSNLESFGQILKIAKNNNYSNVLIFEDDAYATVPNAGQILSQALNELPRKWGIVYLGCYVKNYSYGTLKRYSEHLLEFNYDGRYEIWGSHSVLFNRVVFDTAINYIFSNGIYRFLTDYMVSKVLLPISRSFIIDPILCFQSESLQHKKNEHLIHGRFNFPALEKETRETILKLTH